MHLTQSAGYGVTIYVESLIEGLASTGEYEQVLLGSEYYDQQKYRDMVDKLITIPMDRNISKQDIKTIKECRKIVKAENPDILYCHSAKAGIYGRLAAMGTKTKVVYNPHGWSFNMHCSGAKKAFYKLIEVGMSVFTDKIVCISEYEKNSTPGLISRRRLHTITNGIDVGACQRKLDNNNLDRKSVGIPEDAFVVGIIARISEQKGQDLLVEAARKIKKDIPSSFFLIVGGKSDDIDIEGQIAEAGFTDSFLITGEVKDAVRYAALMDLAVMTSRWEGFGLVLPEYMMAKKAIVAFAVDAVPDVVGKDGKCGVLIGAEDTDGLYKAVVELHNDPERMVRMGENGYKRAHDLFDLRRVVMEHIELFKGLRV